MEREQTHSQKNELTSSPADKTFSELLANETSNISKENIALLIAGKEVNDSTKKAIKEFKEKGIPDRKSLWVVLNATASRVAKVPSLFFKLGTVLPTVALIFQTFFLGTKTDELQSKSMEMLTQGELMQVGLSALGTQTESLKEELDKRLSDKAVAPAKPITMEDEKQERKRRKRMMEALQKRILAQLSEPSNPAGTLSADLKTSIAHFTAFCQPYQLLHDNLSPERAAMLDFLLEEKIDSSDRVEIFRNADFQYADCRRKKFIRVNFSEVNLQYANFEKASFASCNLRGTRLNNAVMDGCSFWNSDLKGAEMETASLVEGKLRGANLHQLKLTGADISNIAFNDKTKFDGSLLEGAYGFDKEAIEAFLKATQLDSIYSIKVEAIQGGIYYENFVLQIN